MAFKEQKLSQVEQSLLKYLNMTEEELGDAYNEAAKREEEIQQSWEEHAATVDRACERDCGCEEESEESDNFNRFQAYQDIVDIVLTDVNTGTLVLDSTMELEALGRATVIAAQMESYE